MAFGPLVLILFGVILLVAGGVFMGAQDSRYFNDNAPPEGFLAGFFLIFGLMMIVGILSLVSMIMYIIHMSKNKNIPADQRIFWILGMVLFNGVVQIVYFFVYITKEGNELPYPNQSPPNNQWS